MPKIDVRPGQGRGEGVGFLASLAFTALASVRDVYFGGVFQSTSPLGVAVVAFTLCSLLFLPIALARSPPRASVSCASAGVNSWGST